MATPDSSTSTKDRAPHLQLLEALDRAVPQKEPPLSRRIFVMRTLRMEAIDVIGFDMDYTLAIYNQRRIESLSVDCTLQKMVTQRGYPQEILRLAYDPAFAIRGLVIDRQNGNVLKMDRYGYVGRGYHGAHALTSAERRALYHGDRVRLSHPRYAWIDTLFALPESVLFARIVDLLDRDLAAADASREARAERYQRLWVDIRESIDEAHRDESIKRVIKANLSDYLLKDLDLAATLHRLRSAGKRLFLLTNSALDYTEQVMTYLLDGELPGYASWRDYFDAIVVDARKPAFFVDRAPLYELDASGERVATVAPDAKLQPGRVYQGGNVVDFGAQVGCSGDRVLYVGDHIYGDMLRAKKASVWRTAMIIQELEDELRQQAHVEQNLQRAEALERRRTRVESELRFQQLLHQHLSALPLPSEEGAEVEVPMAGGPYPAKTEAADSAGPAPLRVAAATVREALLEMALRQEALRATLQDVEAESERLEEEIEQTFNPYWGPLFKEGAENSRFGEQVEDYACLYTSRVSNFLAYSPLQFFRSPRDHLPHERVY